MPSGMSFPASFTPAVNQDFLKNLLAPIQEQEDQDVGQARSEALARGLEGDAMEGSLVGEARRTGDQAKSKAISDFNFKLAGMGEQENLAAQGEQYTLQNLTQEENFSASEAQKTRDFQEKMARMGYAFDDASARRDNIYGLQGALTGYGLQKGSDLISSAIGF